MTTFALVHGGWHGGWAWEKVAPQLERAGHTVVAPDLPCDDPAAGTADYARTVADALPDAGDVVLVGHSLGGLTVPLVAARRPVNHLVLIAALPAEPGRSLVDQLRADPGILLPPPGEGLENDDRRRTRWRDAEAAARFMYTHAPPLVAASAFARLRWQAAEPQRESSPLE